MVKIEYLENGITKNIILDFADIMDAVNYFKACMMAKIEHGEITYFSAGVI